MRWEKLIILVSAKNTLGTILDACLMNKFFIVVNFLNA